MISWLEKLDFQLVAVVIMACLAIGIRVAVQTGNKRFPFVASVAAVGLIYLLVETLRRTRIDAWK